MIIINNPPYSGSLHLKILREAMKHSDDIVNLSPIRWLQDPLAKLKKSSDIFKYQDIVSKIEQLETIRSKDACKMFNVNIGDLGIYHITKNGGWDYSAFNRGLPSYTQKVIDKAVENSFMDVATPEHWRGKYEGIFGIINSHSRGDGHGGMASFISENWNLFCKPRYTSTNKVLFFNDENERRNCFDYLNSKFMKLHAKNIRQNYRVPWQFVPYLDFSHPWTDDMLYKHFGLTEDEIKTIEKEIKCIS